MITPKMIAIVETHNIDAAIALLRVSTNSIKKKFFFINLTVQIRGIGKPPVKTANYTAGIAACI